MRQNKRIEIRCSDEQHAQILRNAGDKNLTAYILGRVLPEAGAPEMADTSFPFAIRAPGTPTKPLHPNYRNPDAKPKVSADLDDGKPIITIDDHVFEWKGEMCVPELRKRYGSSVISEIRKTVRSLS